MDIRARSDIAFRVTLSGQQPEPQNRPLHKNPLPTPSLKRETGPDKVSFSPEARQLAKTSLAPGETRVELIGTETTPNIFAATLPMQSAPPSLAIQSHSADHQPQSETDLDAARVKDLKPASAPARQRLNLHI